MAVETNKKVNKYDFFSADKLGPYIKSLIGTHFFNSRNQRKIYLGLYLNTGDKKILGTFCQNRDQIGTTFV